MTGKFCASALLFASIFSIPAFAAEPPREPALPHVVTVDATVAFGDLDLATPAGVAELYRRARRAAMDMCRPEPAPRGELPARVEGGCLREAMANARFQIERTIAARAGRDVAARTDSPRSSINR